MRASLLRVLRSTAAVGAVALGSTAANAACTTANNVVTCTEDNTTDQVNSSLNNAPPPSVSLVVTQGAIVARGASSSISPSGFRFPGAIGYDNSGTVGTPGANVDFTYFGSSGFNGQAVPTNTFTFTNSGIQNGGIFAFNVGGAITGTNSGTVTRGIDLRGAGPIAFANTGSVFNTNTSFFGGGTAITLISSLTTSLTGADGITRTTETGDPVTATIGGTVGVPATATAAFRPQGIFTRSVGGVDLTVIGTAGQVSADARGSNSDSLFTFGSGTTTTQTLTQISDSRTFGGNARVTIGAAGQVTNVSVQSGLGTATAIVDGAVAPGPNFNGFGEVVASALGSDSTFRQTRVFSNNAPFTSEFTSSRANTNNGGAALVDVSATGRVTGRVGAASNAGSATVRIAGQVGNDSNFSSAVATSDQTNSTFQSRSISRADGSFDFSNNSTASLSGSEALVTVAATGQVSGSLLAQGNSSATIDNAGRVRGGAGATSNRLLTTGRVENSTRTIATDATGVRTQVDRSTTSSTVQSLGGTASVTNRVGGTIRAEVGADGIRGASVDNGGSIAGGVSLRSVGIRRDSVSSDGTTTTSAPATGGGATTTMVRDFSTTAVTRATGGAVTGTYGGTVGVAPPASSFSRVSQIGNTSSTATVTGTLFADFFGTAGAENRDFATNGSSRQVTQPSGASIRDQSQATRDAVTQIASTSSLTVASTGRILANAFGSGSAFVSSAGGNAAFTLDGGRVDGDVDVDAGAGTNRISNSNTASTFTRAASAPGTFVPEVQQSQTSDSSSEQRAAPGAAIVQVNSGTIGGNLSVFGTGTGAGSLGADVLVNGTLTGELVALASGVSSSSTSNDVQTRTGAATVARTTTNRFSTLPSTTRGGVLVNVGGTVGGGVVAGADLGNVTVNLTGRANTRTADGVVLLSFLFPQQSETVQTSTSTSFNGPQVVTGRTTTNATTVMGGTATLNVAANAATHTANASSIEGDVFVQGFAGSTLNVAAGSRSNQTAGGLIVGAKFFNSTNTTADTFLNGAQTGSAQTSTATAVGGLATVNNAGIIGSTANRVNLQVGAIGGGNVLNTGTINGDITATSENANRTRTTTITDANNLALRRTVAVTTLTAVGGPVQVNNAGLVTGGITAVAAAGTVTNSGVVRSGVTLGGPVSNFTTTTTTTATPATPTAPAGTTTTTSPSVANAARFNQTYTLNQNGILLGGVNVTGMTSVDPSGATVRTSNVNATVNLNNSSVTFGNIVADGDTVADVNLNGTGFLGVAGRDTLAMPTLGIAATGLQSTPSFARFSSIDPSLGTPTAFGSGSRVTGVRNLTKAGDGTFVIVGAPLTAADGTTPANYTLDIGTLRINGGELQLGTVQNSGVFGIRGNVENNAGLVLGLRTVNGTQSAVQGINLSVLGNFTNAAAGSLFVGANPALVRSTASSPFTPFVLGSPFLANTNSFVRVDGNVTLAGNVAVQGISGGLYEAGRLYDLFSVSGSYSNTGTVRSNFASPFVSFTLTPRTEGARTVVSLNVVRANFDTVTTDSNARNAAGALQAVLPSVFGGIRSGGGGAFNQDFASIVARLDTQLTTEQAAQVFRELSSGEFYGSLSAVSTTAPFGDATDGLPTAETSSGVGLWFRPTAQFARYRRNENVGAAAIGGENLGGSIGLNFATGAGGHIGVAGGYGKLDIDSEATESAEADTYMVGIYGVQQLGGLHVSAQAVYGKSEWDAVRTLPLLGRTANSSFDSDEIRATLRVAYTIAPLTGFDFSPFAKVEARRYEFDGFTETGANAVSLVVGKRSKTVVTPEAGFRISGSMGAKLRPFAEASYIFQGDVGSERRLSFIGNPSGVFTSVGVDPSDSIKGAIGVAADIGLGTAFIRGDYHSGGDQQVGSVRGGLLFSF